VCAALAAVYFAASDTARSFCLILLQARSTYFASADHVSPILADGDCQHGLHSNGDSAEGGVPC
jgi:hypothetical protein